MADTIQIKEFSTCLRCGDPLVATFAVRKKEWVCLGCCTFTEFLHTGYSDATPTIMARYVIVVDAWQTIRALVRALVPAARWS